MTDDAIIEKVAQALWQEESLRCLERQRLEPWSDVDSKEQHKWQRSARAALASCGYQEMRTAIERCQDYLSSDFFPHKSPGGTDRRDAVAAIRAALDKAEGET